MAISGTGSFFAFNGLIAQVGNLADGELRLTDGTYAFATLDLGLNTSQGPATVTADVVLTDGVNVTISDLFGDAEAGRDFPINAFLGRSFFNDNPAYGHLTVSAGASLTFLPTLAAGSAPVEAGQTFGVGIGTGGVGQVRVQGAGSRLSADGAGALLRLGGDGGSGMLDVSDGGTVETVALRVGTGAGATGRVGVDGVGSFLLADGSAIFGQSNPSDAADDPPMASGVLEIANGGHLLIEGGADQSALTLADGAGSLGHATIDGAGSLLTVSSLGQGETAHPTAIIGNGGRGSLDIQNLAEVRIAAGAGTLSVSRADTAPVDDISVLTISSGGKLLVGGGASSNTDVVIGHSSYGNGRLDVSGDQSRLTINGDGSLTIGNAGHGEAVVEDGAEIVTSGDIFIGTDGGDGLLEVSNATVTLGNTSSGQGAPRLIVGEGIGSAGALLLRPGGRVEQLGTTGMTLIAPDPGTVGSITVDDTAALLGSQHVLVGAALTPEGHITAEGGEARLDLNAGAQVDADEITVGTHGQITLTGADLAGLLKLHGTLSLSPDEITTETLAADTTFMPGARIALDVVAFETGATDQLVLKGAEAINLASLDAALRVDDDARFFIGDRFEFAETSAAFPTETIAATDTISGRRILLSAEDQTLSISALQGSAISILADGTIGRVTLPAARDYLDPPGNISSDIFAPLTPPRQRDTIADIGASAETERPFDPGDALF